MNPTKKSEIPGRTAAMEDLALHHFLMGLHPRISNIVRCKSPRTLNEAIGFAISEEKIQQTLYRKTENTQKDKKPFSNKPFRPPQGQSNNFAFRPPQGQSNHFTPRPPQGYQNQFAPRPPQGPQRNFYRPPQGSQNPNNFAQRSQYNPDYRFKQQPSSFNNKQRINFVEDENQLNEGYYNEEEVEECPGPSVPEEQGCDEYYNYDYDEQTNNDNLNE
ncbi:uncharacterized protein LOC123867366 [Maniola jurtina]|uniref:uncharacterized protein LOC123867366 n=1 Tax=Maniola jurtina TaxID=191418 RepID=UPI001E68B8C0|nr:uncharacterized protein LOC123867366 [Maniola jurtina]